MNAYVGTEEQTFDISRYPSRFMLQNHLENIDDLNLCMKVRRLNAQALPGDEFPLTPSKFTNEYYLRELWYLRPDKKVIAPFVHGTLDLDDFSSMLRWLELAQLNAFGAGLIRRSGLFLCCRLHSHRHLRHGLYPCLYNWRRCTKARDQEACCGCPMR